MKPSHVLMYALGFGLAIWLHYLAYVFFNLPPSQTKGFNDLDYQNL